MTDSSREYEIVGDSRDTIAVTLFRSVGVLGKEELLRRPGRPSGIKMETPDAQMLGKIRLHLALTTHPGTTKQAKVAQRAKRFLTPLCTYHKMPLDAIKLHPPAVTAPKEYSLLAQSDEDAVLSAVKRREDGRGIILRFFNPTSGKIDASFQWKGPLHSVCRTRLDERPVSSLEHHRGRFSVPVKPNEVQTVSIFDRSGAD